MADDLNRKRAPGMSALAQRLPGQRTPPDPSLEQPNAADLTYGWHHESSSEDDHSLHREGGRILNHFIEEDSDADIFTDAEDDEVAHRPHPAPQAQPPANDPIPARGFTPLLVRGATSLISVWSRWVNDDQNQDTDEAANADGTADQNTDQSQQNDNRDSFVCRICFDGPGSVGEGGESLGKLIAPCRCRGTMKFVHQGCLTRWRSTSRRQTSIMQCDQCGAPYRFKKSPFVGLATNKFLLVILSCFMFISLVWIVGYAAEATMAYMDEQAVQTRNARKTKSSSYWPSWLTWESDDSYGNQFSTGSRIYSSINLDRSGDAGYDDDDFYGYRYDYRYGYSEPAAYYTLIKAAVKYVGSGRAFRHILPSSETEYIVPKESSMVIEDDINAIEQNIHDEEKGWWSALIDDWKYGHGGIWEGQRPVSEQNQRKKGRQAVDQEHSQHSEVKENADIVGKTPSLPEEATGTSEEDSKRKFVPHKERYDARSARPLAKGEKIVRPVTRKRVSAKKARKTNSKQNNTESTPSLLERIFLQMSLGASLVGMSSFLTLLLGISTWAPFHLNLGLGRGFARVARRRARGSSGGGGGEGEALVAVFLLVLVIVGIIRALFAVYSLTNYLSKRLLTRVEDIILDWGSEEDNEGERGYFHAQQEPQEQQHPMPPHEHINAAQQLRPHWRNRINLPAWTMGLRRRNRAQP